LLLKKKGKNKRGETIYHLWVIKFSLFMYTIFSFVCIQQFVVSNFTSSPFCFFFSVIFKHRYVTLVIEISADEGYSATTIIRRKKLNKINERMFNQRKTSFHLLVSYFLSLLITLSIFLQDSSTMTMDGVYTSVHSLKK